MPDVQEVVAPYLSQFERFRGQSTRGGSSWTESLRSAAISHFAKHGFPTPKHEEWKYTNIAPIVKTTFTPSFEIEIKDPPGERLEPLELGAQKCTQLVFVNGRYSQRLSWRRPMPKGVRVSSLADDLLVDPRGLEGRLGKLAHADQNPFTALNTAFFQDGALVDVPRGAVVEEPIHLLFLSVGSPVPVVSYPRNLLLLGEGSRATIIETYAALDGHAYLTNGVTEIEVGPQAVLDHYKRQQEGERGFHVATTEIHQGRDSRVSSHSISLGAVLARNDINTLFEGEGGDLVLNGMYMVSGKQVVDHHTRIDHAKPSCTSRELYKGVLDGLSRGVFNGKVFVRQGAMKTNASQSNKNLLLSRDAFVDSTPGLEILADDVKCKHGSSIGHLDDAAIFYLRTRGIDDPTARNMLTYAFAAEMINLIRIAPMRVRVNDLVMGRLPYSHGVRGDRERGEEVDG